MPKNRTTSFRHSSNYSPSHVPVLSKRLLRTDMETSDLNSNFSLSAERLYKNPPSPGPVPMVSTLHQT